MRNRLDLRDLAYFEAIAELGHMGRAAERLHLTQPALTRAVARLQEAVGAPLLDHVGRGIALTAAGHALQARARSMRIAADEAVREIRELGQGVAGTVRVGMVPTAARFLLPPICRHFLETAPAVTFNTFIGHNDVLRSHLKAGALDVVITFSTDADPAIESQEVFSDEVVVVASRGHAIFRRKPRLADLLDYRWVLAPQGVATRTWLDAVFQSRSLPPPTPHIETNLILLLPALIEENRLLSFVSRRHLGRGAPLKEVPMKETTMHRTFAISVRRGTYLSPAAARFVEVVRGRGAELFGA